MKEKSQIINNSGRNTLGSKSYSADFRAQVIEVYKSGVYSSMADCARNYNIPPKMFYQWLESHKSQANNSNGSGEELAKLRKENRRLNQELDILKKAAAYFAKEMK